jgi:translation initiation factor IF-1
MVKNSTGGCRAKSQARKLSSSYDGAGSGAALRLSSSSLEVYAVVTKQFGQGRCQVHTVQGLELQCVIRNKFRGRSKRNNTVVVGTIVLIGLYEWQSEAKGGDVLEVYNTTEVGQLSAIPSTRVQVLEKYMQTAAHGAGGVGGKGAAGGTDAGTGAGTSTESNEFVFSHEDADDFGSKSVKVGAKRGGGEDDDDNTTGTDDDDIDIDDI